MELVYLWVEDYKNIHHQGFNFSPKFECKFHDEECYSYYWEEWEWEEVDPKLYTPIDQGIVLLKHGEKSLGASAFYAFIFSKKAEEIFLKFGYGLP